MRVISGKYKGRKLDGFKIKTTRPTMDRVKESIFGMLQEKVKNSICLDLFAGSGSLGIEAISNGAAKCYFVDNNKEMIKILNNNLKDIENVIVFNMDFQEALKYFKAKKIKFDLILLDPPYKMQIINMILNYLEEYNLLNDKALIVCEMEDNLEYNKSFNIIKEKKYGDKTVVIYQKSIYDS